jgi:hypothetical protein
MTTTITIQGVNYTIPNDKVAIIVDMLKSYRVTETRQEQVREVLTNQPFVDGKVLING